MSTLSTQTIETRDLTFRVLSSGAERPGSPTFVLVHGIGTSHRYMRRLHEQLARTSLVHSIDVPGFGGLPKPPVAPSVEAVAAGIAAVLDELGASDVVVIGHSMGSQWVVETALARPRMVRSVVVIGPVTDDQHRTATAQARALAIDVVAESLDVNVVVTLDYLRCGMIWFLREVRHMVTYRLEERVGLLDVPLLILRGGNDPIAGIEWCRRLRGRARFARVVIVPGHHHVVQYTAPRSVASAITAFLATGA